MATNMLVNRLQELITKIDQLHLMYLEIEDSPKKIEQREKLEQCVKEFLYIAPHNMKFVFKQTADVLHRSASTRDNFSGYRAGLGFKAVGKYADNLLAQPWRREYREIKLYCGYYKHEIESNLVGAELMLEFMGYKHTGNSTMILSDILDPDRITNASRDALTAYVECQIMKHIWEVLCQQFDFTWLDILEFRENHAGTADQAIKALTYRVRLKQYEEQLLHRSAHHNMELIQPRHEYYYGTNMGDFNNHVSYIAPQTYTIPLQTRFIMNPTLVLPPPPPPTTSYPQVLKPQELYPNNGYHIHSHNTVPTVVSYSGPVNVPTAQLIEVDTSNQQRYCERNHIGGDNSNQQRYCERNHFEGDMNNHQRHYERNQVDMDTNNLQKYRERNHGEVDSSNQQRHCERNVKVDANNQQKFCEKNHVGLDTSNQQKLYDERIHVEADTNNQQRHGERNYIFNQASSNTQIPCGKAKEDGVGSWENWDYVYRNLESQGYRKDMGLREDLLTSAAEQLNNRFLDDTELIKTIENLNVETVTDKIPSEETTVDVSDGNPPLQEVVKSEQELEARNKILMRIQDENEALWQCVMCTYLNKQDTEICEMCSKSKHRGAEQKPQPSGGSVCPVCTLVNERGFTKCAVCDTPLENSPTYI